MNKKIIALLSVCIMASGCTSIASQKEFNDSVSNTSESFMFNFKDPLEKITYVIFKDEDIINPEQRQKIIDTCHIEKDGISETDFKEFVKYDKNRAQQCLDLIFAYKHPSFLTQDSLGQKAYEEFQKSYPIYEEHFFAKKQK